MKIKHAEAFRRDHENLSKTINNNRITITAASDAMKVSEKARLVISTPAKAEERWGKDSEQTICGGIGISVFIA